MRPERCWGVILTLGLLVTLSPLSAQAGPNRPVAPQPNRQAFTPPQPRGSANGWNSQPHQWRQPHGNAYGWNGHQGQWDHRNAYGWNGHQGQWQQPRPSFPQGERLGNRQFQPPNGGQQYNLGSSYNRGGHWGQAQSANIGPNSSGYSHNTPVPAGQTGAPPSFRQPDASGNAPLLQGNSPEGVI